MELFVLIIFCLVYLGMVIGNIPGFALDRTGIALLGAIAIILLKNLSLDQAVADIDISSIALLFGFMIVSSQFYFSGFYTHLTERMLKWSLSPQKLLFIVILFAALLSAVLINDIVCLAMTGPLIKVCLRKNLNPIPFLLGLACGSNIGSALTLIGNPQNMLIGQVLHIPFREYTLTAFVPCVLGLLVTWWVIVLQTKGKWHQENPPVKFENIKFNRLQSYKGLIAIVLLVGIFLIFDIPRENVSLAVAGCLLLSRQMASRMMLNFIDWQLLVLFIGLFIVNREFNNTVFMQSFLSFLENHQVNLQTPAWLFTISAVFSNLISNVPAVMLLLPFANSYGLGSLLALSSTLAGNMFIIGSIANIIVVSQASRYGIHLSWKRHFVSGFPISLITLGLAALWLYFRY